MKHSDLLTEAHKIKKELVSKFPSYKGKLGGILFQVSNKMTRMAGKACPETNIIKLSYPFYKTKSNFDSDFRDTVLHEIAHLLVGPDRVHGIGKCQWHGKKWKKVHKLLGGNGKRCHEMKLTKK